MQRMPLFWRSLGESNPSFEDEPRVLTDRRRDRNGAFIVKKLINQAYHNIICSVLLFYPDDLCVTNVSVIILSSIILIPDTKSPEVIPVAQNIESPLAISSKLYFFDRSIIPIALALCLSLSVLNINLP